MRGVGVIEFGGPEALQVVDLPEVHAGAGEVRIRVHAVAVNPTDTMLRNGGRAAALADVPPPYIPGMDLAGIVDEVGPDTDTSLAVGDAVMAMVVPNASHGAYRESIVLTARQSLDQLALSPGQTIAVTGAAGCYGGYVVQLAKAEGLRVIADASEADEQLVADLGADVVVRRGDDVAGRFRAAAPDGGGGPAGGAGSGASSHARSASTIPRRRRNDAFAASTPAAPHSAASTASACTGSAACS